MPKNTTAAGLTRGETHGCAKVVFGGEHKASAGITTFFRNRTFKAIAQKRDRFCLVRCSHQAANPILIAVPAGRAIFARPGFVHIDGAVVKACAVELRNRILRFGGVAHLDEPEALGAIRIAVNDDLSRLDIAEGREKGAEIIVACFVRKVSYVDFHGALFLGKLWSRCKFNILDQARRAANLQDLLIHRVAMNVSSNRTMYIIFNFL
jgi:hypothetical protein